MILIINSCSDKLSEYEFIKPIKKLISDEVIITPYFNVNNDLLDNARRVIISGTALKDFDYFNSDWSWIKSFNKPLMGICAGYQVIARELGGELINKKLIGVFNNHYFLTSKLIKKLDVNVLERLNGLIISFKKGDIIAYAYHPEVLNPELIKEFIKE